MFLSLVNVTLLLWCKEFETPTARSEPLLTRPHTSISEIYENKENDMCFYTAQ